MQISERKLAANRANAQKSTGPRTETGKSHSSQNSVSHGLYAKAAVINSPRLKENHTEYHSLLLGLIEELDPVGATEEQLVRNMANCLWRLRRAMAAETAHLNNILTRDAEMSGADPESKTAAERALADSVPRGYFSEDLLRYETRADMRFNRAYRTLVILQNRRKAAEIRREREKRKQKTVGKRTH